MTALATLLLAHLIADFPLQTNSIFKMKVAGTRGLTIHVAIHVLTTALLIHHPWQYWPILLLLGVIHYFIDWAKLRLSGERKAPGFVIDQIVHVITLVVVARWLGDITAVLPLWFLLLALILAFIPAILTFLWVWASDLRREGSLPQSKRVHWASQQLLPISQRMGWAIVIVVAATSLIALV
jgi:hypothetical protein